jgi:hypothetical protein
MNIMNANYNGDRLRQNGMKQVFPQRRKFRV